MAYRTYEDEELQEILYYRIRTPGGAAVRVSLNGLSTIIYQDASQGEPNFDISRAFAKKIQELKKRYILGINEFGDVRGNYLHEYPRIRAIVEYLDQEGLLEFNGEKAEVEDVGPPFKYVPLPPADTNDPTIVF